MGFFFFSLQDGYFSFIIPSASGFIAHFHHFAGFKEFVELSLLFIVNTSFQRAEAVEVFDFDYRRFVSASVFSDNQIDVRLETHVALLHIGLRNAQESDHSLQFGRQRPHFGAAVHIRLSNNLQQWRAGSVQIHLRKISRCVKILAGVLFQMRPDYPDLFSPTGPKRYFNIAIGAERQIILAYLIILRQIRIVIALPIPLCEICYLAIKRQPYKNSIFKRLLIHHRQDPRHTKTHRTDPAVGLGAKLCRTTAKHLCLSAKLYVNFQSYYHPVL